MTVRVAAAVLVGLLAACSGGGGGGQAAVPSTTQMTVLPCPSPVGPPAIVETFRSPAGACLPIGQASIYQCSLASPVPAAIVGGRRFLGGVDAYPVDPDPTATVVGAATDGTTLATVPTDPDGVRVTTDAGTQRWPALPATTLATGAVIEGAARPAVFVVGDSVILGAQADLAAAFARWGFTMDAAVNRPTRDGLAILQARRAEIADVVVVGLGYNDGGDVAAWTATATQIVDSLQDVPLVVWLTLREARGYYADDNAVLRQLASTHPNLVLADWWSTSIGVPATEFSSDGLHLHPAAARAMAALVKHTVDAWNSTHPDRGDQSCRPAVDAAVAAGA